MKLGPLFIVLLIIIVVSAYALSNWQRYGSFIGKRGYENVKLVDLISFGELYDGKDVCTNGYVIEGNNSSFIKDGITGNKFEGSAWLINNTGKNYFFNTSSTVTKAVSARVCGHFVSERDGEFGNPPYWRNQMTINEFSELENPSPVDY